MSLITPLEHKEDILEKGYRCISHLWVTATRWHDHPVKGVEWGVDLRKEKRTKLLQIFNHFKGYWWMNVFCTDQDSNNKPLGIMGDVYKNCTECICMLDIKIPQFFKQPSLTWYDDPRVVLKHVLSVGKCKWNKRVWTLQEWVLPKTYYTEETFEEDFHMIHSDSIADVLNNFTEVQDMLWFYVYMIFRKSTIVSGALFNKSVDLEDLAMYLAKSGRKCKNPEDYYYGISGIFDIPLTNGLSFRDVEKNSY